MATTTTYSLIKPTVGGDENTWGADLNTNFDSIDDLLDGTTAIAPNLTAGSWEVGGVAVTATAAELNTLDGVTASAAEINMLDGVTWTLTDYNTLTATAAELNILDGVTASTAELNILDGLTASTAELNILDGVTATASELNALDGVTATGTSLIQAADAAAGRLAISAPAIPIGSGGAGQFTIVYAAPSASASLPAGGTWAYFYIQRATVNSGVSTINAGVAAGGTSVVSNSGSVDVFVVCWRVS
jgi:hypothetical protein